MKFYGEFVASCLVLGLVSFAGSSAIQEHEKDQIEIVDRDGRPVDAIHLKVGDKKGIVRGNVDVQVEDGKIIIVDQDGTRREIDVSGAQNIIVNKSVQSIIENGEEKKQVMGKAIIIGPNGERQEIELGDGSEGFEFGFGKRGGPGGMEGIFEFLPRKGAEGGPGSFVFSPSTKIGKFMIGVHCKAVPSELRAHLNLEDGVGLVVSTGPKAGSPADEAGIQQHDILIYADQQELETTDDLVEVVQAAGDEDRDLNVTLVRKGNEMNVDVKPVKRQATEKKFTTLFPGSGKLDLRVERVGPGFVFESDDEFEMPADLMKRMEEMNERMKQQMEEMTRLQEEFQKSIQRSDDNDN